MQSAHDRDKFVKIYKKNVPVRQKHNFIKYGDTVISHFGEAYDFYSLMHYDAHAFSKNLKPTIVPIVSL